MDIVVVDACLNENHGRWSVSLEVRYADGSDSCWLKYRYFDDYDKAVACWQTCDNAVSAGAVLVGNLLTIPSEVI